MSEASRVCNVLIVADDLASERARVAEEIKVLMQTSTHALRTPLWAMQEFSGMLSAECGTALSPVGRDYLDHVLMGAQRLTTLVNALTDYAGICQRPMRRAPANLSRIVEAAVDELRKSEPERCVRFRIEPDVEAEADADLMRIALGKLLANAWKYTRPRPAAEIGFGRAPDEGEGVYVVWDNGVGFDEELIYKLFGPFQRLHVEKEFEGLGMGLAIVRRVIHLHNGRVWAQGAIDQGARFYFTLASEASG